VSIAEAGGSRGSQGWQAVPSASRQSVVLDGFCCVTREAADCDLCRPRVKNGGSSKARTPGQDGRAGAAIEEVASGTTVCLAASFSSASDPPRVPHGELLRHGSSRYKVAYSYLNATTGSALAACQAGRNAATPATSATQPVATTKLSGSKADSS
jgi:hypothetical protein